MEDASENRLAELEIALTPRRTEVALEDASPQPTSRLEDIYPLHTI
jgi:hypothetical protein